MTGRGTSSPRPRRSRSLAALLSERRARRALTSTSTRSILDSVATRLDEGRDLTRYLTNLLIFLGLLGTFYGLATVVPAVVNTIRSLAPQEGQSAVDVFDNLMVGLEDQLGGMGTAFGSSLLGLSGSLAVGLLELFSGHGQNRFFREIEEWLSSITVIGLPGADSEEALTAANVIGAMQETTLQIDALREIVGQSMAQSAETETRLQALVARSSAAEARAADRAVLERIAAAQERAGAADPGRRAVRGRAMLERIAAAQEHMAEIIDARDEETGRIDAETRARLRSIDTQVLRILEDMATGRQDLVTEMRQDLSNLIEALRAGHRGGGSEHGTRPAQHATGGKLDLAGLCRCDDDPGAGAVLRAVGVLDRAVRAARRDHRPGPRARCAERPGAVLRRLAGPRAHPGRRAGGADRHPDRRARRRRGAGRRFRAAGGGADREQPGLTGCPQIARRASSRPPRATSRRPKRAREATEAARAREAALAEELRARLKDSQAELTALTLSLEAERKRAEETLTLLAAAEAARDRLQAEGTEALTEAERRAAELAQARALLAEEEQISTEAQRQLAVLNQQTAALRAQLASLQELLGVARGARRRAQVQIENLGSQLNAALARAASEERARAELEARERARVEAEAKDLERYRSEFFGRMRDILGEREGVQVVGDRFVFPAEVLFHAGSAVLGPEGRAQVARVAAVIREIADDIPPEIDWVLRVDGHTDRTPLTGGGPFADNWELSQARALSVVRYMTEAEGLPANRLAATGFGEFQPIDPGSSPEALARNRRIELKFTER